jgi:hypothetical protein
VLGPNVVSRRTAATTNAEAGANASFSASLAALPQKERLKALLPLAMVHVPKCSAPFSNAVIKLPGVCRGLPKDVWVCSETWPDCETRSFGKAFLLLEGKPHECLGIQRWVHHAGFRTQYASGMKGHGVIMLRQPEERLISAYYNPPASFERELCNCSHTPRCDCEKVPHGWPSYFIPPRDILDYVMFAQGTAVKMLTRDDAKGKGVIQDSRPPTRDETMMAVRRLHEGFAFVGIVEQYMLSVCLFHAMFGNTCHKAEILNYHTSSPHPHDIEQLRGFVDVADRELYAAAQSIFETNLRLYSVSPAGCEACYKNA